MKKDIIRVIALLVVTVAAVFTLVPEETVITEKAVFTEDEANEPTPLVIETKDREETISNPRPATVVIVTPYQDTQCWTGLMYINPDGKMTRVTLFDAVESDFDDNF